MLKVTVRRCGLQQKGEAFDNEYRFANSVCIIAKSNQQSFCCPI